MRKGQGLMPNCPDCGGSNTKSAGTSTFQFVSNRKCKDCETVWTPACPKWAAVLSVVLGWSIAAAGAVMTVAGLWVLISASALQGVVEVAVGAAILGTGAYMARYGTGTFHGIHGQLKIIKPGRTSDGAD